MKNHFTEVRPFIESKRVTAMMGRVYVANCSCGWQSVQHDFAADAQKDADRHVDESRKGRS